ncbi:MAG: leucine-rich repeat protein, partial [Oscillospiraceae bacterium]|nr:leucine-rich repeat protein [Oscillospiraceae bacterium]
MKRQILSILLVAAMLCALLPAVAFPANADIILPPDPFDDIVSGTCGDLKWELNKTTGVLTISGTGEMTEAPWLDYTGSIRTVNVGDGVTSICEGAFRFCTKLTTVTIPVSVTVIGKSAFSGCTGLTDVNYAGTPGDWNAIQIGGDNASLTGANLHTAPCPHTNTRTEHKNAACLTDGYDRTICDDCEEVLSETILPALGHDLVTDAAVPATCTETGLTAGEHCARCSYKLAQEVVPALGHDLVTDAAVPATCTEAGLTEGCHCSRCDYKEEQQIAPALGHAWDAGEITLEPTEFEKGEITFTCTRCGETRKVPIPELSHVHSYTAVVTPPTCTEQGYTTHTCSCGDSYVDTYVPALGHELVTDPAKAATCTETGLTEGKHCTRCDYKVAQEVVPALGHAWDEGKVTKPATATAKGEKTFTCTRCGATRTEDIPATGGGSNPFKDIKTSD